MVDKTKQEQGKELINEFEDMKDKATINALSEKSLREPLTEQEFNDYQNAFFRYYKAPNILKQSNKQVKGGKK